MIKEMSQKNSKVILKLYRETDFPRKIKAIYMGIGKDLGKRERFFRKELDRRGLVTPLDKYSREIDTVEIKRTANLKIRELREKKDYIVEDLSLLHFIECVISESSHERLDLIKVEICLILFHQYDMFTNVEDMMRKYEERGLSIFDIPSYNDVAIVTFLDDLYIYLFDVGRMLVSELGHDFLISKRIGMEPLLTPNQGYDEKYEYFKEIPYFYMK
jgi:hypothetical protein